MAYQRATWSKPACTMMFDPTGETMIRSAVGNKCACSKEVDQHMPRICDIVCPTKVTDLGCECKDPLVAGRFCENPVCKSGEAYHCLRDGQLAKCFNIRRDQDLPYPPCPCFKNGRLANGVCVCDQYYSGVLCETYIPPPTTTKEPSNETDSDWFRDMSAWLGTRPPTESTTMYVASIERGYRHIIIPTSAVTGTIILIIVCAIVLKKRREGGDGGTTGPKLSSPTEKGLQTAQVPTVIIEDEPGPSAPLNQPQPSTLVRLPGVTPKPAPAPAAPYTFYPGGRPANGAQDGRTQAQVEMNYRRYK